MYLWDRENHMKLTGILTVFAFCAALSLPRFGTAKEIAYLDFEDGPIAATLKKPAHVTDDDHFVGTRCLKVPGTGENYQYFANLAPISAAPGQRFGVSCVYRTSEKLSGAAMMIAFFKDGRGKIVGEHRIMLPRRPVWHFAGDSFTIPEDATRLDVFFRLSKVPAEQHVLLDSVRLTRIEKPGDFYVTDFSTTFDNWNPRDRLYERCQFGPGGALLHDWQRAHVGEACVEAHGDNTTFQYPFRLSRVTVEGGRRYRVEVHYKMSESLLKRRCSMLIFFYYGPDGKPAGQERLDFNSKGEWTHATMTLAPPKGAVFVDIALRLYNVTATEAVYLDNLKFRLEPPQAILEYEIDPDSAVLTARVGVTSDVTRDMIRGSTLSIAAAGGQPRHHGPAPVGEPVHIPLADWPNAEFRPTASVHLNDGRTLTAKAEPFTAFVKQPWLGKGIGRLSPDAPPAPWKPVTLEGTTARTWNNDFAFGAGLRLDQVTFLEDGQRLLKQPLRLLVNGSDVFTTLRFTEPTTLACTPNQARMEARGGSAKVDFTVSAETTFDGLVTYTVSLVPKTKLALDQLRLDVAVEGVEFLNRSDGSWTHTGATDLADRQAWADKRFFPVLWLGNLRQGLYWYAEKLYPAKEEMPREWVRITRDGQLTLDLVNAPLTLKPGQEHRVTFAFGVTPMRPDAHLWRTVRFRAEEHSNMNLWWAQPNHFRHFGFPVEAGPRVFDKSLGNARATTRLFYQAPAFGMTSLPQWKYFEKHWKAQPSRAYAKETSMQQWGHDLWKVDITRQTWTDLYLDRFVTFLDRFPFEGVYYDCIGVASLLQGEEFTYPVFALRDFVQRIYIAQRSGNPNSITMTHTGANFCTPGTAYSELILMGEQYRAGCMEHDYYLQFMSLRQFRFENCTRTGADRMFLPQYRQEHKSEDPRIALHTMGLVMCHNLLLYPASSTQRSSPACARRSLNSTSPRPSSIPTGGPIPTG